MSSPAEPREGPREGPHEDRTAAHSAAEPDPEMDARIDDALRASGTGDDGPPPALDRTILEAAKIQATINRQRQRATTSKAGPGAGAWQRLRGWAGAGSLVVALFAGLMVWRAGPEPWPDSSPRPGSGSTSFEERRKAESDTAPAESAPARAKASPAPSATPAVTQDAASAPQSRPPVTRSLQSRERSAPAAAPSSERSRPATARSSGGLASGGENAASAPPPARRADTPPATAAEQAKSDRPDSEASCTEAMRRRVQALGGPDAAAASQDYTALRRRCTEQFPNARWPDDLPRLPTERR